MKNLILAACILLIAAQLDASSYKDEQRFKRNDRWKAYVAAMQSKLSEDEFAAFESLCFEGNAPGNDFQYIKDDPVKKYKIANYEYVKIPTTDNLKLDSWFFPVQNAKGTLIILHGYSSDMSFGFYQSKFLLDQGYQLLIYNARFWNYSKKPETYVLSIEKEMGDVGAAIAYLKTRKDVDMNKLGLFGFSQGAYKAILAGARYQEFKVVMEDAGPLDRIWFGDRKAVLDLIRQKNGEDFLSDEYTTSKVIARIAPRPVLILHGGKDMSVNVEDSKTNFDAALEPKEFHIFPKSAHCLGMVQSDKQEYIATVIGFLEKYLQ